VHNELCERLGIEFPISAFTPCRDVAASVSNAGGMGVLGAVGFSADRTDAWERDDTPDPLGMPLQMMVAIECVSRGHAYPEAAVDVNFNPAGQIIGRATSVRRTRDVVLEMVEEYIEAVERVQLVDD